MAGALTSAKYKLNSAPPINLTASIEMGALNYPLDLYFGTASSNFFHISTDQLHILLNSLTVTAIDEESVAKEFRVLLAREFHKMFMLSSVRPTGSIAGGVTEATTLGQFLVPTGWSGMSPDFGFFQPFYYDGTIWNCLDIVDPDVYQEIMAFGSDFFIGLHMQYTDTTTVKHKYIDLTPSEPPEWTVAAAATAVKKICVNDIAAPKTVTILNTTARKFVSQKMFYDGLLNMNVLDLFNLDISDIDAGTSIILEPFVYLAPQIASISTSQPTGYALLTNPDGIGESYYSMTQTRASSANTLILGISSIDENYTSDDYGFISDSNNAATTDTTVNLTITPWQT